MTKIRGLSAPFWQLVHFHTVYVSFCALECGQLPPNNGATGSSKGELGLNAGFVPASGASSAVTGVEGGSDIVFRRGAEEA